MFILFILQWYCNTDGISVSAFWEPGPSSVLCLTSVSCKVCKLARKLPHVYSANPSTHPLAHFSPCIHVMRGTVWCMCVDQTRISVRWARCCCWCITDAPYQWIGEPRIDIGAQEDLCWCTLTIDLNLDQFTATMECYSSRSLWSYLKIVRWYSQPGLSFRRKCSRQCLCMQLTECIPINRGSIKITLDNFLPRQP